MVVVARAGGTAAVRGRAAMAVVVWAEGGVASLAAVGCRAEVASSPQVGPVRGAAERAAVGMEVAAPRAEATAATVGRAASMEVAVMVTRAASAEVPKVAARVAAARAVGATAGATAAGRTPRPHSSARHGAPCWLCTGTPRCRWPVLTRGRLLAIAVGGRCPPAETEVAEREVARAAVAMAAAAMAVARASREWRRRIAHRGAARQRWQEAPKRRSAAALRKKVAV